MMKWTIILLTLLCAALYLLYRNGYLVTQVKSAVKYVESQKGTKASFSYCSGHTRRVVRFKESKTYRFTFAPQLSKGAVVVELLDAAKNPILRLDGSSLSAEIRLEQKSKYYLVFRFSSASGKYVLSWE